MKGLQVLCQRITLEIVQQGTRKGLNHYSPQLWQPGVCVHFSWLSAERFNRRSDHAESR
jgi:hypothetical protein